MSKNVEMNEKIPNIKINAILNVIRNIMSIIFPLVTYPYITRLFSPENLGKVNFSSTFISYFSLLAVLGITRYAAREGIQYRKEKKTLNIFCNEVFTLNLLTTFFSYIALTFVCLIVTGLKPYIVLITIYSITILFSTLGMEWLYTLHENYLFITAKSIAMQFISMVLLFVFVREKQDYYIYAIINVLATVGGNIFDIFYVRKKYVKLKLVFNKRIFKHLIPCLIFFFSSLASSIYSNIDTTMLGFISGDYYTGIYAVAQKIYSMIKLMLAAVMTVVIPRLTSYKFENKQDEYNKLFSKLFKTMFVLVVPCVIGLNVASKEIIFAMSGKEFMEAEKTLRILSFAIFFAMFASLINAGVLIPCRKENVVLLSTIVAALLNVITNLFMIPLYNQNGAAATTVLAEFVVLLLGLIGAKGCFKLQKVFSVILTTFLGSGGIVLTAYLLEIFIVNMFLLLAIKILACVTIYFIVLLLTRNEIVLNGYGIFKNMFNKSKNLNKKSNENK